MEDEEWEDVLVCSYLTPPDALGPKAFTDAQFEELLKAKEWAEIVSKDENSSKSWLLQLIEQSFIKADKDYTKLLKESTGTGPETNSDAEVEVEGGALDEKPRLSFGTRFLCLSKNRNFLFLFSWGNTVVHVKRNGEIELLFDINAANNPVQFVLEHFDHLFVFRDYEHPKVYKNGIPVSSIPLNYENFTSKGVIASKQHVYYTQAGSKELIKVSRDLSHCVVPGTEKTSDFVVLKDERLFWITKSHVIHSSSGKSIDVSELLKMTYGSSSDSLMVVTHCGNLFLSVENKNFLLMSPELEIIDSVLEKKYESGYHMRICKKYRNASLALIHTDESLLGALIRNNKIHILESLMVQRPIYSISPIEDFWVVAGDAKVHVLRFHMF